MRRLAVAASVAAITLIGGQASAASYLKLVFSGSTDVVNEVDTNGHFEGSFTAFLPVDFSLYPNGHAFINGEPLALCSLSFQDTTTCWQVQLKVGDSADLQGYDEIEFWYNPDNTPDFQDCNQGRACRQFEFDFEPGAFGRVGIYHTVFSTPDDIGQPGLLQDHQGTLSVSLVDSMAVPEPSTWAMLLSGFAALGAMLRLRRHQAALA